MRIAILLAEQAQLLVPDFLGIAQNDRYELLGLVVEARPRSRRARIERTRLTARRRALVDLLQQRERIAPQQPHQQHENQRGNTAADHHRTAYAAAVLDIFALLIALPAHG